MKGLRIVVMLRYKTCRKKNYGIVEGIVAMSNVVRFDVKMTNVPNLNKIKRRQYIFMNDVYTRTLFSIIGHGKRYKLPDKMIGVDDVEFIPYEKGVKYI